MKIRLVKLWSANYYPWQSTEYPWLTQTTNNTITLDSLTPIISYGFKVKPNTQDVILEILAPIIGYGFKVESNTQDVILEILAPKRIGKFWSKIRKQSQPTYTPIQKNNTNWTKINKPNV